MEKNGELPDYDELASEEKPSGGPQKDNLKDAEALLNDNDSSMETEEGGSGKPIKKNQSGKSKKKCRAVSGSMSGFCVKLQKVQLLSFMYSLTKCAIRCFKPNVLL